MPLAIRPATTTMAAGTRILDRRLDVCSAETIRPEEDAAFCLPLDGLRVTGGAAATASISRSCSIAAGTAVRLYWQVRIQAHQSHRGLVQNRIEQVSGRDSPKR